MRRAGPARGARPLLGDRCSVEEISLTTEDHRLRKSQRLWTRPHTFIYDENTLRGAMIRGAMTSVGFAQITKFELEESHDLALRGLENETRMPPGFFTAGNAHPRREQIAYMSS